jgi:ribosomal protein L37AE/L43A
MQQDIKEVIACPLCGCEIAYTSERTTHIWSCPDCPFVGFEYYQEGNAEDLTIYLNK